YDALGRVTKIIPTDGSKTSNNIVSAYSGSSVTVTDQAGKKRRSVSDGLGRIIEVDEPGGSSPATAGSGSATVNGNGVQVFNLGGVAASGSVTIGGQGEQSHAATTATGSVNIQQVGQGWASVNQPYWGCVLWFDDGGCATM